MSSDEEIKRVRRLIDRMNGDLNDLSEDDRAQIEEAVAVVRQGRRTITALGLPRFGQPLPDVRPRRSA